MRVHALFALVGFLSLYAWRDWYRCACALVLLMAVVEHPDVPKTMLGVQGLNPWNILLASTVVAWLCSRQREKLVWDLSSVAGRMLLLYLLVVLVGFARMMADRAYLEDYTTASLWSEYLINTVKWVLPGLMIYDGCRAGRRVREAIFAILCMFIVLAIQVIRWMPPGAALTGVDLQERAAKVLMNEVGYHRVNLSAMLSGGSWAILCAAPLLGGRTRKVLVPLSFLMVAYGQALTGGRMGYVTWGLLGAAIGLLRWRRMLLVAPMALGLLAALVPQATERMLQGFGGEAKLEGKLADDYEVTSGRTMIWPYVVDKIRQAPILGFGRLAMTRTGLSNYLSEDLKESFPHPHNAYLELLLDNGLLGFLLIIPFYLWVLGRSVALFRRKADSVATAVGGIAFSLTLSLLLASFGSQTFYPREGWVGMWAAIFLMMRISQDRLPEPSPRRSPPIPRQANLHGRGRHVPTRV